MKILLIFAILFNFSYAKYYVYFTGIKLGETENLDSIKENYLEANVTNSLARFLLGKDKFVFYNDKFNKIKDTQNTKYKKDTKLIIKLLQKAQNKTLKPGKFIIEEDKFLHIKIDKKYYFTYISHKKIKSEGYFELEHDEIKSFYDTKNNIKIIKE